MFAVMCDFVLLVRMTKKDNRLVAELVLCALNDLDKVGAYIKLSHNVTTESWDERW